jgi:serine/threonine-protein kinase
MTSNLSVEERLRSALSRRYRIEREVGSGGMAAVYLATDLKHNRKVAVKALRPDLGEALGVQRFLREVDVAARLTHPHILPLHDSGEADGLLYFVMPFVEGESLQARLRREKQLPLDDAIQFAREIADALAYAHQQGVIHRDIKPANILLEAGHAVLADFGIAQAVAEVDDARLTGSGVTLGTPAYMSPEQASGQGELDGRSDQYSLACVLYEMLVGQPPFTGPTEESVVRQHLTADPPDVTQLRPSVGPGLPEILRKALEKTPADRFPLVREFGAALRSVIPADITGPVSTPAPGAAERKNRRHAARWLVSAVTTAVLVIGGGFIFLGSTNDFGFSMRDWILITDFQNATGESVFDRSLNTALAIGLEQSNHLNVFPKTRVAETLQRMLREDTGVIDEELGGEIARRENLTVLVVPSIDKVGSTYMLGIRMIDPLTGEDVLSRSMQADGPDEVLPALDRLARRLRRDLGESLYSVTRQSVPLGQATTPSLEALEAWSEGQFHWGQRRFDEAVSLFQRAIELDSSFAMAHQELGGAYYYMGDRQNGERHFETAVSLTDRITERERLWIQAEIENWRENYESAVAAYNIYLTRFQDDLSGWFRLGFAQMRQGHNPEAVQAFARVAELDPTNVAAYINLATSYNQLGEREKALEHYLNAFELRPEWRTSGNLNHEFGFNYAELGEIDSAEAVFREMLSGPDDQRALGYRSLGLLNMYVGRYREAQEHLRQAVLIQEMLGYGLSEFRSRLYLATALSAHGAEEAVREELARARALAEPESIQPNWLQYVGKHHARRGMIEETEHFLANAISRMNADSPGDRAAVALLRGELALAQGMTEGALRHLQTAYAITESSYALASLAFAHYVAGDLERAEEEYLTLISRLDLGWEAQEPWAQAHYRLGNIYQQLGDTGNALKYYRALVEVWEDGDDDILLLAEARRRIEELSG